MSHLWRMLPQSNGAIRLFRFAGIQVYVHWSWFLGLAWFMQGRYDDRVEVAWRLAECLTLFAIVLMHEFGHALACRSVGGRAEHIVLWPLGGVAYVAPPVRPGAVLWSIAAGPLVNVVLFPIFFAADFFMQHSAFGLMHPGMAEYFSTLYFINTMLLVFNLMPIYPLDGGQIFQSLLWFFLGQSKSLKIASVVGILGAIGLMVWAIFHFSLWLIIVAFFLMEQAMLGFRYARTIGAERNSDLQPPPLPKE